MKNAKRGRSEYESLEAENKKLRKEVNELQKEIMRLKRKPKPERMEKDETVEKVEPKPKITCESCGGHDMLISKIPSGTLVLCKSCKARRVDK